MNKILSILAALAVAVFICSSCEDPNATGPVQEETIELMLSVPAKIECATGDVITINFYSGKGPKSGDVVMLKKNTVEFICPIVSLESDSFSFELPKVMASNTYSFCIKRGETVKVVRDVEFVVEQRQELEQKEGYNIYGMVSCDGVGVPGVVVSDGVEVTVTDEKGAYYLKSNEYHRTVFMSVPAGYEAVSEGVLPKFHRVVDGNSASVERADWNLVKVDNDDHIVYVLGDMHLANRTNDLNQFASFTDELNKQVYYNDSKRQYAITLGDMTWELYWYDNAYDLYSYVRTINESLSGLQVYHTIGNHDHDMATAGDLTTVDAYKNAVAPTYYSFNIGNNHYVVLDDILCKNDGTGGTGRDYSVSLTVDQLNWLRKDLSYVDKSKNIVVTMHAQMYDADGKVRVSGLEEILKGYNVHVMTGHSHEMWNNDFTSTKGIYHHNSGAVCATWWWTGKYTPGLGVCPDGSPAGYYMYEMTGNNIKWRFKPIGKDFSYMFRSYDRNEAIVSAAVHAPNADAGHASAFNKSASDWNSGSTANYVYINVFDYDPSWKIVVTENGNKLDVKPVETKDPLHLISYEAMRRNVNAGPTFPSENVKTHMFRVQASSPTSTLEIKVTDRFGNISKETMKRPKAFSINAYK